jgi:adenylate cyclase
MTFDFVLERVKRAQLRHTMSLYFSPRVLDAVLADPGSMDPRRADVTLLLTDLRNSTPLAELLGPIGMFNLLNRVFEVQTEAIMGEDGNLEHFLGDQFLSYWGAPQAQPGGADHAARAALKLIRGMEGVRESLAAEVKALFGYGVALHSGSVLVGNKGSSRRLDYGLVGDVVNEAARVEALTKMYGAKLMATRETLDQLATQGERRLLDRVIVKGKSTPVDLYELENPCIPANYAELCRRYEAAHRDYQEGRFGKAREAFEVLASEFGDGPSKLLAARCAQLIERPPAAWEGVWSLENK